MLAGLTMNKAVGHLCKDPVLKILLSHHKPPILGKPRDLFTALVRNIIGQQLSGKAAGTIIGRFEMLFGGKKFPAPEQILAVPDQKLRDVGMSWAKARYVKELCRMVSGGLLDLERVKTLPDEEVVLELTKVKGIGRWTAEMILIFHLQRPDVFSLGDLGLRTAVSKLYKVKRDNLKRISKIATAWSPHRSLACLYLWKSLDND